MRARLVLLVLIAVVPTLIFTLYASVVFAESNRVLARGLVASGFVALFAVVAAWLGTDLWLLRAAEAPPPRPVRVATTARRDESIMCTYASDCQQSEDMLRKLSRAVKHAGDSVFITDRDGIIEYVNPAFEALTGYAQHEIVGRTPRVLKSGEHDRDFYQRLWQTVLAGDVFRAVFTNRKKDGTLYYEDKTVAPLRDGQGAITHFVSAGRDITEQKRAEEALRRSEERSRLLLEASPDPIVVYDGDAMPTYLNPAFVRAFGWTHEELLGTRNGFVPEDAWPATLAAFERLLAGDPGPCSFESHRARRDNAILDVQISASLLGDETADRKEIIVTHRDVTERKLAALRHLNTALEQEARRIAHALHDEAGQLLAAVHVAVDQTARVLPPEAHAPLDGVKTLLDEMEVQLRRLSHELRPTLLDDLGLGPALSFLAEGVSKRTGIAITVDGPESGRLGTAIETALYRVVQEALTNVSRHAHAKHVHVALGVDARGVSCSIRDDGIGFDVAAVLARRGERGLGLIGIRERLEALGGTVDITSGRGTGTQMRITIPRDV